jgi:hypothetical protein
LFRRENLIVGRLDVCPRCLLEDAGHAGTALSDTAYFCRAEWCLDVVDTCRIHRSEMVTVHRARGPAYGFDFSNVLVPKAERLHQMAEKVKARTPTGLQDYVLARLEGCETGAAFLDGMDLFAAIRTCEMLGTAACYGRTAQCDKLDAARLRTARIRGFEIGSCGEEGVKELLKAMTAAYTRRRTAVEGQIARLAFAALYNFLHVNPKRPNWRGPAFATLRTVVADFIKTNFPLKPGDTVFREVITERKLHSVRSLAAEIGCGAPRVRKLLRLGGVIGEDQACLADHNIVFDAKVGLEAVRESLTALPHHGVAKYLGTRINQVYLLAEAKFIEPIASGPLGLRATFAPAVLDAFVAKLLKGAETVKRKAPHHVTIRQAALRAVCSQAQVVRLILDGRLNWVGSLGGKRDYRSILIDLSEVDHVVHGLDPDTMSTQEFADRLGLKTEVGRALAKHGHVKAILCERAGHQVSRIPASEVEAFRRRYVSLGELSRLHRTNHMVVKKMLDERGVLPAFDLGKVRVQFYRRDDISS